MKAYIVTEDYECRGGVVFANRAVEARRFGADEYNNGEFSGMSVKRAKGLDKYAKTGVPAWLMIADGWSYECCGCGEPLGNDDIFDRGMSLTQVVGTDSGSVFCDWTCEAEYLAEYAATKAYGEAFLSLLRGMVKERFGPVKFPEGRFKAHAYCRRERGHEVIHEAQVFFELRGLNYGPASLRYQPFKYCREKEMRRPEYHCCGGDRPAFEAWAAEAKAALCGEPV